MHISVGLDISGNIWGNVNTYGRINKRIKLTKFNCGEWGKKKNVLYK